MKVLNVDNMVSLLRKEIQNNLYIEGVVYKKNKSLRFVEKKCMKSLDDLREFFQIVSEKYLKGFEVSVVDPMDLMIIQIDDGEIFIPHDSFFTENGNVVPAPPNSHFFK